MDAHMHRPPDIENVVQFGNGNGSPYGKVWSGALREGLGELDIYRDRPLRHLWVHSCYDSADRASQDGRARRLPGGEMACVGLWNAYDNDKVSTTRAT